jgi:hypothetical protein
MNKKGLGGSQIAAAMAILFFHRFVRTLCGRKNKPPLPAMRDGAALTLAA